MSNSQTAHAATGNIPTRSTALSLRIGGWLAILLAIAVLSLWRYDYSEMGVWVDDATYIGLARALWHPDSYGWLAAHTDNAALPFPPGYSLVLAPLVVLFPNGFLIPQLTSLLFTLLSATVLYWGWPWFAPGASMRWAVAVTVLYGVSSLTIQHTRLVMSEPLFTFLALLALLVVDRAARNRLGAGQAVLLGALLAAALLVRSVGIILIGVVLTYLFLRQGRHAFAGAIAVLATIAAAFVLILWITPVELDDLVPSRYLVGTDTVLQNAQSMLDGAPSETGSALQGEEIADKGAVFDRLRGLAEDYLLYGAVQRFGRDLRSLVFPLGGGDSEGRVATVIGLPWLSLLIGYLISATVWLGFAMVFVRKRGSAFMLFGVTYLALTVLWVSSGYRLFYPIMPQLYFAFLLGIDAIVRGALAVAARVAPTLSVKRSPVLMASAFLLVVLSIYQSIRLPNTRDHVGSIAARTSWLAENAAADDVIMTEQPVVDFVYSQHKALWYPRECPDAGELATYLDKRGVDYVLVAPPRHWQAQYKPAYSDRARCVLTALETLSRENRVELAHASEANYVQVFRHLDE